MSRLSAIILGTTIALVQPTIAWAQDVYDIAKEITVFIDGCSSGSGVIYDKKGNTYYVLTAYHVVDENPRFCRVITTDGESYDPGPDNIEHIGSLDLAVVKFVSNKRYQVGTLGDSQSITIGKTVYIAGAPPSNPILEMERTIRVSEGKIIGRASQASEGYTLIYDNTTRGGMSGGPILN
ncbi:MAG: serine protease, partial [Hormoscilla sp.]